MFITRDNNSSLFYEYSARPDNSYQNAMMEEEYYKPRNEIVLPVNSENKEPYLSSHSSLFKQPHVGVMREPYRANRKEKYIIPIKPEIPWLTILIVIIMIIVIIGLVKVTTDVSSLKTAFKLIDK